MAKEEPTFRGIINMTISGEYRAELFQDNRVVEEAKFVSESQAIIWLRKRAETRLEMFNYGTKVIDL